MKTNTVYLSSDMTGDSMRLKNVISKHFDVPGDVIFIDLDINEIPANVYIASKLLSEKPNSLFIHISSVDFIDCVSFNRDSDVRAIIAIDVESAELAKKHIDANVLIIQCDYFEDDEVKEIVEKFINTEYIEDINSIKVVSLLERI